MDNVTTFETSLLLQENGFPQPKMQVGQIWWLYTLSGQKPIIVTEVIGDCLVAVDLHGNDYDESDLAERVYVFSPTSTDILRELGKDYNLSFFKGLFYCIYDNLMGEAYSHENPAEACALAYLDK